MTQDPRLLDQEDKEETAPALDLAVLAGGMSIAAAIEYAERSPYPEVDELTRDVYSPA